MSLSDSPKGAKIPITPGSSSWFEFLLDPNLLESHVTKPECVPTPSQLIIQFLQQANAQATQQAVLQKGEVNGDAVGQDHKADKGAPAKKKVVALKVLALKTAAYLNWNLDLLEESLPASFVMSLLLELITHVVNDAEGVTGPPSPAVISEMPDPAVFALQLYHRWCLRLLVKDSMPTRPAKVMPIAVPGLTEPVVTASAIDEEKLNELWNESETSLEILKACLTRGGPILITGPHCFIVPTESEQLTAGHDLSKMTLLTEREYLAPICYDMGSKYFLDANYAEASRMFEQSEKYSLSMLNSRYAFIDNNKLSGYLSACHAVLGQDGKESTLSKLDMAKGRNDWLTVVKLLADDVNAMEIPSSLYNLLPREASTRGCPSELLARIDFCSDLRAALRGESTVLGAGQPEWGDGGTEAASVGRGFVPFAVETLDSVAGSSKGLQRKSSLKSYARYLLAKTGPTSMFWSSFLGSRAAGALFEEDELLALQREPSLAAEDDATPRNNAAASAPVTFTLPESTDAEDERQLFFTYDDVLIRQLMLKLLKRSPHFLKTLCDSWKLPKDVARLFNQVPGVDSSYSYVLTAKAKECVRMQEFAVAKTLLTAAEQIVKGVSAKLSKMLRWEILHVDLLRCRQSGGRSSGSGGEEQQQQQHISADELSKKVKTCLTALKSEADIYPGDALIQECVTFLLNVKDWDYVTSLTKLNMGFIEFARLLADTCKDRTVVRAGWSPARVLWDAVVHIFAESATAGTFSRKDSGPPAKQPRPDEAALLSKDKLRDFVRCLQEPIALTTLLSLLSRLYNVAKGDASISIASDYATMWPTSLDKVTVDVQALAAVSSAVLTHALSVNPHNSSWLKMQADIYFTSGNYNESMRYYLEAGAVATHFFSEPVPKYVFDDQIYRRLIKCCTNHRRHTQAAILCQFLDEIDYTMAFKCLQEKTTYDAADAYYSCIWDMSILEFLANLHCKRGELEKRQYVLNLIGQQELNSSNGEAIIIKAANIRKMQFLTMLTQQYVNSHSERCLPAGTTLT